MTCQETGGPMSDVRQGPVKWHAILGYELLWRKSPEATESFEVKAIFFSFLFHGVTGLEEKEWGCTSETK